MCNSSEGKFLKPGENFYYDKGFIEGFIESFVDSYIQSVSNNRDWIKLLAAKELVERGYCEYQIADETEFPVDVIKSLSK